MALRNLFKLFSSEVLVVVLGLCVGVFVARAFGAEGKGLLAGTAAIVGLTVALSSFGVSYSAVKLGGENTNRIMCLVALLGSTISLLFLLGYQYYIFLPFDISNNILKLYILFFCSIYNLQSLAFIVSRPSGNTYSVAIICGQLISFIALSIMFFQTKLDPIWILLSTATVQFVVSFYYIESVHVRELSNSVSSFKEYISSSFTQAPIIYLTSITIHIPILLLSAESIFEAGLYAVAASSVLMIGKVPRLMHGMSLGGIMFHGKSVMVDFIKLQLFMVIVIIIFHALAAFLIEMLFGASFSGAVTPAVILAYSMLPLLFISLAEGKLIVVKKYKSLIVCKAISCLVLALLIFGVQLNLGEFNSISLAWCILYFRLFSAIAIFCTTKWESVEVFG